jgi:hypothetical protein
MLRFALLAMLAAVFSSCLSDPDCVVTSTTEVKIDFLKVTPDSIRTAVRDTVKLDSILVSGTDSIFYVADTVSSVVLPVNSGAYETTFFFYRQSQQDSIKLSYTRTTRVISPACGAFNYFQDLSLVLSTVTEAKVTDPQLSTTSSTNVTIKF